MKTSSNFVLNLFIFCIVTFCYSLARGAEGPKVNIHTIAGDVSISKAYLNYCNNGNENEYLKLRQLTRQADETERARSCAEVARSIASIGDQYLAFQYYRISCDAFNYADSCQEMFRMLDKLSPEHHEEAKQVAVSVCQQDSPIVGRTPYKLAVDIRGDLCYSIGQKIGVTFPKKESDLTSYRLRTSILRRACELGKLEACKDLSFNCETYQVGCSETSCPDFSKSAQQITCSASVSDDEAKRFVRNKDQADDEREKVKEAKWQERVKAAKESQIATEIKRQQSLENTLSIIRTLGAAVASAIGQPSPSAAMAGSGREIGHGASPSAAQLENICSQSCSQQTNACKQAGAQRACYEASACVKRCFATNAPNDPHRSEWLQGAADDERNAAQLSNTPYRFDLGRNPPTATYQPDSPSTSHACNPQIEHCVSSPAR